MEERFGKQERSGYKSQKSYEILSFGIAFYTAMMSGRISYNLTWNFEIRNLSIGAFSWHYNPNKRPPPLGVYLGGRRLFGKLR